MLMSLFLTSSKLQASARSFQRSSSSLLGRHSNSLNCLLSNLSSNGLFQLRYFCSPTEGKDAAGQNKKEKSRLWIKWTKEEDNLLVRLVSKLNDWEKIASHFDGRSASNCKSRWYLAHYQQRKKEGKWSDEELDALKKGVSLHGRDWAVIASMVGRTSTQCRLKYRHESQQSLKGFWTEEEDNTLRKCAVGKEINYSLAQFLGLERTPEQMRQRLRVLSQNQQPIKKGKWSNEEREKLRILYAMHGSNWRLLASLLERSVESVQCRWFNETIPRAAKAKWTEETERKLLELARKHARRWPAVSAELPPFNVRQCKYKYYKLVGEMPSTPSSPTTESSFAANRE